MKTLVTRNSVLDQFELHILKFYTCVIKFHCLFVKLFHVGLFNNYKVLN